MHHFWVELGDIKTSPHNGPVFLLALYKLKKYSLQLKDLKQVHLTVHMMHMGLGFWGAFENKH